MSRLSCTEEVIGFLLGRQDREELTIPVNDETKPALQSMVGSIYRVVRSVGTRQGSRRIFDTPGGKIVARSWVFLFLLLVPPLRAQIFTCIPHSYEVTTKDITANTSQVTDSYDACPCLVTYVSPTAISCNGTNITQNITESGMVLAGVNLRAVPAPTPTPTPTPTPVTLTFDPCPAASLTTYQGVDFGRSQWSCEGAWSKFTTSNIYFSNNTVNDSTCPTCVKRTLAFVSQQVLVSIQAVTDLAGTLTLTSDAGETVSAAVSTSGITTVTTGWAKPAKTITVQFSQGWHVALDNLVYR